MKRKIFFWLEKLRISRGERTAVSTLMAMLLLLFLIYTIIPTTSSFDDDYYASLEEVFQARSKILRQKEQKILARYRPQRNKIITAVQDTFPRETSKAKKSEAAPQPAAAKINVNTADAKTLESLPGIGPVYADRIVKYRQKNGGLTSHKELLKIKGIGKKRLEKLLPFIQLKESIEN